MEELEQVSEEEKHSFRKLCEQIHRAFDGNRKTYDSKRVLYSLSLQNQNPASTDKTN